MKDLFLVTTGLKDTWPKNGNSILFLGEWCRLYTQKCIWENIDAKVVPYHWDDRKKLKKDYHYLIELFERVLNELSQELNRIHNVSYSLRYWRIVIGPWLISFLTVIFDRWSCLQIAVENYPIKNTIIQEEVDLNFVPQCMEHYCEMVTTDPWNHAIYSLILKQFKFKKTSTLKTSLNISRWNSNISKHKKNFIYKIKNLIMKASLLFSRNDNYFFISTYLSKTNFIKLNIKLGQVPVFYVNDFQIKSKPNKKNRSNFLLEFKSHCQFEEFLKKKLFLCKFLSLILKTTIVFQIKQKI